MHTISQFFNTVWRSATDLSFYTRSKLRFWSGFWYVYWLSALLLFVLGVVFAVRMTIIVPKVESFLAMATQALDDLYPSELKISIVGGSLSTNVTTPYTIDIPVVMREWLALDPESTPHLVVIDPDASVEEFPSLNTLFLATRTHIAYPDKGNRNDGEGLNRSLFRVGSLKDVQDMEIDRASYDVFRTTVESFFPFVTPILITLVIVGILVWPFLGAFFAVIGHLFILVFSTVVLWILSLLLRVPGSYARVYVLSLYGLTGSAVLDTLQSIVRFRLPFVSSIIFWGWMIAILVALRPRERTVATASPRKQ